MVFGAFFGDWHCVVCTPSCYTQSVNILSSCIGECRWFGRTFTVTTILSGLSTTTGVRKLSPSALRWIKYHHPSVAKAGYECRCDDSEAAIGHTGAPQAFTFLHRISNTFDRIPQIWRHFSRLFGPPRISFPFLLSVHSAPFRPFSSTALIPTCQTECRPPSGTPLISLGHPMSAAQKGPDNSARQ